MPGRDAFYDFGLNLARGVEHRREQCFEQVCTRSSIADPPLEPAIFSLGGCAGYFS